MLSLAHTGQGLRDGPKPSEVQLGRTSKQSSQRRTGTGVLPAGWLAYPLRHAKSSSGGIFSGKEEHPACKPHSQNTKPWIFFVISPFGSLRGGLWWYSSICWTMFASTGTDSGSKPFS